MAANPAKHTSALTDFLCVFAPLREKLFFPARLSLPDSRAAREAAHRAAVRERQALVAGPRAGLRPLRVRVQVRVPAPRRRLPPAQAVLQQPPPDARRPRAATLPLAVVPAPTRTRSSRCIVYSARTDGWRTYPWCTSRRCGWIPRRKCCRRMPYRAYLFLPDFLGISRGCRTRIPRQRCASWSITLSCFSRSTASSMR